jgi:hypothetical protein
MEPRTLRCVVFILPALLAGCSEPENGGAFIGHPKYRVPENVAHAADGPRGPLSSVTLAFPRLEVDRLWVADARTQELIEHTQVVVNGEQLYVTLKLPLGAESHPLLVFYSEHGDKSFRGKITPTNFLAFCKGLEFATPDKQVETDLVGCGGQVIPVSEGETVVIHASDFTTLWVGDRLMTAATARFVNQYDPSLFSVRILDSGGQVWFVQGDALSQEATVENQESIGLLVAPQSTLPDLQLRLELERR